MTNAYAAAPPTPSAARSTPTSVAPATRRNGDLGGSVSRMTNAATTRWTMNWYECSWSCRDAMRSSKTVVPAPYDIPQVA